MQILYQAADKLASVVEPRLLIYSSGNINFLALALVVWIALNVLLHVTWLISSCIGCFPGSFGQFCERISNFIGKRYGTILLSLNVFGSVVLYLIIEVFEYRMDELLFFSCVYQISVYVYYSNKFLDDENEIVEPERDQAPRQRRDQAPRQNRRATDLIILILIRKSPTQMLRDLYEKLLDPQTSPETLMGRYQDLIEKHSLLETEMQLVKEHFTHRFSGESSAGYDCLVCLSPFEANDEVSSIGCIHSLHYACLINWCKVKPTCPLCRYNYRLSIMRKFNEISQLPNS